MQILLRTKMDLTCFSQSVKITKTSQTKKNPLSRLSFFKFCLNKIWLQTKVWMKLWTTAWINSINSESKTNPNKVFLTATFLTSCSTLKVNRHSERTRTNQQSLLSHSSWRNLEPLKKYFSTLWQMFYGSTILHKLYTGLSSLKLEISKILEKIIFHLLNALKVLRMGKQSLIWRVSCTITTQFLRLMPLIWKSELELSKKFHKFKEMMMIMERKMPKKISATMT